MNGKPKGKRASWKKLLAEKEKEIWSDYNSGELRSRIVRKHKIPEGQFLSIIRNELEAGAKEKNKAKKY